MASICGKKENMISVASEKNISTAKKRGTAPFKVNGESHIILQQQLTRCCMLRRAKNTPTRSFVSRTVNRK
jgi:hypothetical protein